MELSLRFLLSVCTQFSVYLGNGLVDEHPACQGVDPQILRLLPGHGVRDGCIGAKVVIVSRYSQETGPDHRVLAKEVYRGGKRGVPFASVLLRGNIKTIDT